MANFQDLLNRFNDPGVAGPANVVPSQMPRAMGGMPTHGITQDLAPIPGTAIGNMDGMMIAQGRGGFNLFNPFTYGNMKKAIDKTRAGDENVEYSDSIVGGIGRAANEKNRMLREMRGY